MMTIAHLVHMVANVDLIVMLLWVNLNVKGLSYVPYRIVYVIQDTTEKIVI